jgi:hypothetical protein
VPGIVPRNCAVVALGLLDATTGTDREVEPAAGESFVVMFEEQFGHVQSRDTDRPLSFVQKTGGKVATQFEPVEHPEVPVPSFVVEDFSTDDSARLERELRSIDDQTILGTWHPEISALYARLVAATPGLFRRDPDKSSGRYTMRYMLRRLE